MMASNVSTMGDAGLAVQLWSHPAVYGLRRMFYICTPKESSFANVEEVPKYVDQAVPYFVGLIVLEAIVLILQDNRKALPRPNDAFSSLSAGILSLLPLLFVRNIEMAAFMWIHEKYALFALPWDSPWTWILCMLGVDFGYYLVHRYAHEVNFMWAAHQVHHSSEDYNLTTALRQSMLQRYNSWIFYLPLALVMPPPIFVVHIQFNLIYQFWIHTETIKRLGPLEWILNTPSHHRVHHGRNRYCIDKNYAGVLIIWDRMCGTFEAERDDDEVVYGLVHPLSSWDPIYTQLCHWKHILKTSWSAEGLHNKLSVFLKGPGWEPGKPRLGRIEDIPDIHKPQTRYNKGVSFGLNVYAWTHFLLALLGHQVLNSVKANYQVFAVFLVMMFIVWTLSNIGYIFEQRWFAPLSELVRCVVYLLADSYICSGDTCPTLAFVPRVVFFGSMLLCLFMLKDTVSVKKKTS